MTAKCVVCAAGFSYYPSNSSGKYCSQRCVHLDPVWLEKQAAAKRGRVHTQEARQKMSEWRKGRRKSPEHAAKLRVHLNSVRPDSRGPLSATWKGGATILQKGMRASHQYRDWRKAVLARDGYKCVACKSSADLHVDHIYPFAALELEARIFDRLDWLFQISNGRTLCAECHRKTPSYAKTPVELTLIRAIKAGWESTTTKSEAFETFYARVMEQIINKYKEKLS